MQRNSAYFLFLAVLAMLVIGVVMLFSTSAFARDAHGDVYFFIKRQSLWLGIGLAVLIAAALVDYHFWYHTWWLWFLLALGTLALCFVPHFGLRINGSRRWVGAGPVIFQPSEIAKVAAIFFLAWWFSRFENRTRNVIFGFLVPLIGIALPVSLIITEVDLGTSALIGATTLVMLLVVFWFIVVIVCGMMIALHAKDRFGMLLSCGIVSLLALQAAVNIGVTTSLLPNKGLPLPFISYGGSNLAACLFGVGILLNIYRQAKLEPGNQKRIAMQARMTPRI